MVDRRAASKARIAAGLRTFNVLADVVGLTELLIHAGHLVENNLHDPAHEELEGALSALVARLIAAHKLELENAAGDVSLRSSAKVVIIVEAEGHHERTA